MILYKHQIDPRFFSNFKIRFTQAEDLNDLFELVPDIRLKDPTNYAEAIVKRNQAKAYFQLLIDQPQLTEEQAYKAVMKNSEELVKNMDVDLKAKQIFETYMRVTNRTIGVLSLTETATNDAMWAHYSFEQKGFAIGFDSEHSFFQPTSKDKKLCGELMNVIYTDTRPVVYVTPGNLEIPKEVFYTKKSGWSYECEWRMIKEFANADEVKTKPDGKNVYLYSVPPEAVKEVVFGLKIDAKLKQDIIDMIKPKHPHIQFKDVVFHPTNGLSVK